MIRLDGVRYAKALYEVALENKSVSQILVDIQTVKEILAIAEIKSYCLRKDNKLSDQLLFFENAFLPYVGTWTANTLRLMITNGRIAALPSFPTCFEKIVEERSDEILVYVSSATPLEESTKEKIILKMRDKTHKNVLLKISVQPDLISGFKLNWGNKELDLSLSNKFRKLRTFLKTT